MTIFADKGAIVKQMKSDRLVLISSASINVAALSTDYIYEKVLSAEKDIARRLRVFLEPTEVMPTGFDPVTDPVPTDKPWQEEPGYNFDPNFFRDESWGWLTVRQHPIISVQYMRLVYPAPTTGVYAIPNDWLRLDKKYGNIQLVPASSAFLAPLGAFLMQALGGGRTIPHMIRIRYTAGLSNVMTEWPDLVDVIKRQAALLILEDAFIPSSASISADGLSTSISANIENYQKMVDKRIDSLQEAIHGIRAGVMM